MSRTTDAAIEHFNRGGWAKREEVQPEKCKEARIERAKALLEANGQTVSPAVEINK